MTSEPVDAWLAIPPLDRIAKRIDLSKMPERPTNPEALSIEFRVKGVEVVVVIGEGTESETWCRFTYDRRAMAWELFRRPDWVSEGPPSARAGNLLDSFVKVLEGEPAEKAFSQEHEC